MLLEYITRDNLDRFIETLIQETNVYGPVPHQGRWHRFERLESAEQACLDYVSTVLPPK